MNPNCFSMHYVESEEENIHIADMAIRRPEMLWKDASGSLFWIHMSQCCLLQIKERGFAKEWDLAGKRNEVSSRAIYSQDLFSDTILLWILMSTVWIFPLLIVTVYFFFPDLYSGLVCVEFVLLGANDNTRTKAETDQFFFLVLKYGTVLGHEVAKSYRNGFVTEME